MYPTGQEHYKMVNAAVMMGSCRNKKQTGRSANKLYGWLKERLSKETSKRLKGKSYEELYGAELAASMKEQRSASAKGRQYSEEHKARLSEIAKLRPKPIKGKPSKLRGRTYEEIYGSEMAEELRKKRSESLKGRESPLKGTTKPPMSQEHRDNISKARTGLKIKRTPEHTAKIAESRKRSNALRKAETERKKDE
jgi:hypothetical protein